MAKTILEEAVSDVEALKKAAEENAKNYLVEALSPRIQQFINSHMGQEGLDAAVALDAQGQNGGETMAHGADHGDTGDMYEIGNGEGDVSDEDVPDLDLSDLDSDADGDDDAVDGDDDHDFSDDDGSDDGDDEADDDDEDKDVEIDIKDEGADKDMEDDDKDVTEEQVEVTAEDVKRAFAGALKSLRQEATGPGKLGEMEDPNEGDVGLGGKVEKDKQWAEVDPKKTKMSAKEAKEFVRLRKELKQYKEAYAYLKKNLQEMNLFNAKLIYTTRLLQNNLSPKQKLSVVESIDSASNKKEVELVYKTLSESLKIAGVASTNKNGALVAGNGSRVSKPSSTLKESVQRNNEASLDRMALLAGIIQ